MAEVLDTTALQWSKWPSKKTDAVDDTATTDEDNPTVPIDVLSNDKNATGVYKIFPVKQISDVSLTDSALMDSVAAEDYTTSLYSKPYTITLESGAKVTLQDNKVTYDPNGKFADLKEGQSEYDSFGYAAYGRYNTDRATVTVEITGVTDDEPPTGNRAPEAHDDTAYVYNYPYPKPYPYPLPETEAGTTSGEAGAVEADLSDDLIYTTLAIGEEGDPSSVDIDVLWNDSDPDGDKISVGTIDGENVAPGAKVTLDSGATVTLNDNGTLKYDPVDLDYYSPDPLATEGDTAVTASGDTDALVIWEPIPFPYPEVDKFTYQAEDEHGARSEQATVTVYNSPIYYYDVGTDPVLEGTADVGDPSLLVV